MIMRARSNGQIERMTSSIQKIHVWQPDKKAMIKSTGGVAPVFAYNIPYLGFYVKLQSARSPFFNYGREVSADAI
jgi:hypothetical protein